MTPPVQSDIRRSRVALKGQAILRGPQGEWRAPLKDLSVTGLHMPHPPGAAWPVGQAVEVEVHVGPPGHELQLQWLARVSRSGGATIGVHFAPMSDRLEMALQRILGRFGTLRDGVARDGEGS